MLAGNRFLTAYGTTVVDGLVDVDSYAILVFRQPLPDESHLLVELLELVWERYDIALIRGLRRSRHLRQPAFLDVSHREIGGLLNQVILPNQRIVLFRRPLALLQGLSLHHHR